MKKLFPSKEEIIEQTNRIRSARAAYRKSVDLENTFCPLDLGDWIELCQAAGVDYVPAEVVAEAGCEDLCSFDEPGGEEKTIGFYSAIEIARRTSVAAGRQDMLRWSCCAGAVVKSYLGNGEPDWRPEFIDEFHAADLRAFDLIMDFPKPTIRAWIRPWMETLRRNGYPLEFRAFMENDRLIGISSYYPQRPLDLTPGILKFTAEVAFAAHELRLAQKKPLNCPELKSAAPHFDLAKNNWTADFIVVNGKITFLEGGPPHTATYGAHPCCFAPGEIEGIALQPRKRMAGDVAVSLLKPVQETAHD